MRDLISQHVVNVSGQAAAALPPVIVLVFLSRVAGLEAAGTFAVLLGISAAVFSTALWGLRTAIVVDRFQSAAPPVYLTARLMALATAAVIMLALGYKLNVNVGLIMGLVLYKSCDGLLDLKFAKAQVDATTAIAINDFARQHVLKLIILLAGLTTGYLVQRISFSVAFALSGLIALWVVARNILPGFFAGGFPTPTAKSVWQVFVSATWFALAVSVCSILTGAPRFSLAWLYSGDTLGVIGVTLSVSSLFGMILYTAWVRHLPRFEDQHTYARTTVGFLGETLLIALVMVAVSWLVLPQLVAALFAYDVAEQIALTRQVLLASVFFFVGMNTCNLYKVTDRPWMETAAYAFALVSAATAALAYAPWREIHLLMIVAGSVMLIFGIAAVAAPYRRQAPGGADIHVGA